MKITQREILTERNRGGRALTESDAPEHPPSRFLSLSPGGRNSRAFPLVTALCAAFVLLTGGAVLILTGVDFYRADATGNALGAIFLAYSALTWANTERKGHRR